MQMRSDHVHSMLDLFHEAREIGHGAGQRLHLAAGIHRLLGAAMATIGVIRDLAVPHRRRFEREVSTPSDRNARTMIEAFTTRAPLSGTLLAIGRHLRSRPMVTARRRELVDDAAWYRSEAFHGLHRACGFDDHLYSFRAIGPGRLSGVALRRGVGERSFEEGERDLLELFHEELVRLELEQDGDPAGPRLAPREREVLQGLLRGASEKEVAFEMGLSPHTVHSYAKSIYSAYRVSSRAELLVRCLAG
jgi:DNA-binding CsgD family transcriptional regulator